MKPVPQTKISHNAKGESFMTDLLRKVKTSNGFTAEKSKNVPDRKKTFQSQNPEKG